MGKITPISDELLNVMRREMRKHGATLVRNTKTGAIYLRQLTTPPTRDTEAKRLARVRLSEASRKASQWIKANNPEACPPDGTPEYQKMLKAFKRQDKIRRFLNFVMSRIH